jgi:2-C-methyl-D-erythritol 4-phosphate cytidylyltransferase
LIAAKERKIKSVAIIVGAGKGKRIGLKDKAFLLLNKKPILFYSISPFEKSNSINEIILAVRKNRINSAEHLIDKYKFRKVRRIISGGRTRQSSAYNALKIVDNPSYILIHDAVRPLVSRKLIERALIAAKRFGAAIPAIQCKARNKEAGRKFIEKSSGRMMLAQTPQAFRYEIIKKAYENAVKNKLHTKDDASLVEKLNQKVKIVKGNSRNIKITYPADIKRAEKLLKHS